MTYCLISSGKHPRLSAVPIYDSPTTIVRHIVLHFYFELHTKLNSSRRLTYISQKRPCIGFLHLDLASQLYMHPAGRGFTTIPSAKDLNRWFALEQSTNRCPLSNLKMRFFADGSPHGGFFNPGDVGIPHVVTGHGHGLLVHVRDTIPIVIQRRRRCLSCDYGRHRMANDVIGIRVAFRRQMAATRSPSENTVSRPLF